MVGVTPFSVVSPNQGQAMFHQTSTAELYPQQLHYQQFYQPNYQEYFPSMQYGANVWYTQPQMHGASQHAAQAPAGVYVRSHIGQLSQTQLMVPPSSGNQTDLQQLQAPGVQQTSAVRASQMQPPRQAHSNQVGNRAFAIPPVPSQVHAHENQPLYFQQNHSEQQHEPQQQHGQPSIKLRSQTLHQFPQVEQQFRPPECLSQSLLTLRGQQSTMLPQGSQPEGQLQKQQQVGDNARRPPMHTSITSQSMQQGGDKECKASDMSNSLEKQGTLQQPSQKNMGAPGTSSMGQQQTSNTLQVAQPTEHPDQTGNNSTRVSTQQQTSNNCTDNVQPTQQQPSSLFLLDCQRRRDKASAAHHARQYSLPGNQLNYVAPGVQQPWIENGWQQKSLRVNTSSIDCLPNEVFLDVDCGYVGAVFKNSEVEAVRHYNNRKVAHMKFPTQAHAAAVLEKFNRKILPGYPDRILHLAWLISPTPPGKPKLAVKVNPRKRNAESCPTSCSKRVKISMSDIFQPFEQYIALDDREVVETSHFRAAYVVGSIKPVDPGSSKVSTTELGSDIFDGLFSYVKHNHKNRKSWGGKFTLADLLVSKFGCCIAAVPDAHFCSQNVQLDDDRLVELLFPFYQIDGNFPAYFLDLKNDIKSAPSDMETNDVSLEKYIKRILNSPALPKARHRIQLLSDFYHTFMGLPPKERDALARSVVVADGMDWRITTNKDKLLQTMYTDNWKLDKFGEEEGEPRFQDLLIHQALGLRHLTVHTLQCSLLHRRQIFEDLRELDLFIHHYYPDFYPNFVKALLELDINYPVMHTALRNYTQR